MTIIGDVEESRLTHDTLKNLTREQGLQLKSKHCRVIEDKWGDYIEHVEPQPTVQMESPRIPPSLLTRDTLPAELAQQYELCHKPPQFKVMGNKRSIVSRKGYSDPDFFLTTFLNAAK